ncbi:MAG: hypothetical protein LBQ51_05600 [Desulfovibrio sp.]|jgi:hypothetical protein|nr:hypothetical protein [Desulfovibrio sp.]
MPQRLTEDERDEKNIAALDAIIHEDEQRMDALGRLTLVLLREKKEITLDSLIENCHRFREDLGKQRKPEADPRWTVLPSVIEMLEDLKRSK